LVRKLAIKSLGKVRSTSVVPVLQLALQDPDMEVIAVASAIISNYKSEAVSSSEFVTEKLPNNSALKAQQGPE